jgi:hypothetical protein
MIDFFHRAGVVEFDTGKFSRATRSGCNVRRSAFGTWRSAFGIMQLSGGTPEMKSPALTRCTQGHTILFSSRSRKTQVKSKKKGRGQVTKVMGENRIRVELSRYQATTNRRRMSHADRRRASNAVLQSALDHFHVYFALAEIRSVWPFFGGTATSSAVQRRTPKVKMV